ncbi:HAD family hydrolase [Streptomyces sp. J2-1]|nr:HAD family hydrolase [Streptomyces corallincola]
MVLWDFDGPLCRLFAPGSAERVAAELVELLDAHGRTDLLTPAERAVPDPWAVLRAVHARDPGGTLPAVLDERLADREAGAVATAMPAAYADPVIRTWTAVGARMAVTAHTSARAVAAYLATRGLTGCFGGRVHARTPAHPGPDTVRRALAASGVPPAEALAVGSLPAHHEAARAAGVPFLGVTPVEPRAHALRAAGAPVVLPSLAPLLPVLRTVSVREVGAAG